METFKSSTGIIIDEYGTTRLYFDHVKLLLELISKETSDFKGILKKAVELKIGLLIEGD